FNANGGSVSQTSAKTNTNGKLSSLPTPSRSGYGFDGWYTSSSGGTKVTTSTVFYSNTTVYAHWTYNGSTRTTYGWDPDEVVNVKMADPSAVVKDGVIDVDGGEYERFVTDLSEKDTGLQIVYMNSDNLNSAFAMLTTMEFYFSWDKVHGFNFAVRNKPDSIQQLLGVKEGDKPEDGFLRNVGWGISAETDNSSSPTFYFALGKRTDTGAYLEGHWNQLGAQGKYDPSPGEDYAISYDYYTGYCTIEWSVPLDTFFTNGGGAGSIFKATIWATGGLTTEPDDYSDFYVISLGDFGFGVSPKLMLNHVTYNLTDETLSIESPFNNVAAEDYFFKPVAWAVSRGITAGTSVTTFSPDSPCNRGQVVTFLWRAAGWPHVDAANPFTDVKPGDYYYDAVTWAVKCGITTGTSATKFSPSSACTRGQIATFLWRASGSPKPKSKNNPFVDVKMNNYFYEAVLWAVENGITNGTNATHFSPLSICTRGQIVTFLYRAKTK
ncbi:MAG: S-layer homology domain-containing protein, partial [Clostridia bacterium]|nr:S-layer homology domain-containing protein [Clostridia bacterium]